MPRINRNFNDDSCSLVFKIDDESKPTVANYYNYKQSPFFSQIKKGIDLVCNIINLNNQPKDNQIGDRKLNSCNITIPSRNNVIAFLGERGSGKTSCMLSVVNVLLEMRDQNGYPYRNSIQDFDIIDPAFFDSTHNITDIFIGEFYKKYEELTKDYNSLSDEKRSDMKKLQSEFKAVKKALQFLDAGHAEYPLDDIDALSRLSSGVELRRSLSRLVNCYLKYIRKETLLLVIDDLDLNIEASYRMMEEIRKYLVIPNVVILLGAKFDQLSIGISSSFSKFKKDGLLKKNEIEEMAIKYLDKFIPNPDRVFMPESEDFINTKLKIEFAEGNSILFPSVAFAVTSLIYQKTRFLFYNHEGMASFIIPHNLREIRMLVTALVKRKNPSPDDLNIHVDNKSFFKNYFRNQWIPTLDSEFQEFAIGMIDEKDFSKINKKTISFLSSISKDFKNWIEIADDQIEDLSSSALLRLRLRDINNPANANVNITVGDVMATASAIGEIENSNKIARLVFFIHTVYSMKLYELYDVMTDPKHLDDFGFFFSKDTPQTIPVLKNSKNIFIPDYLTLVAGDFFVLTGDSFLPFSRTKSSREVRLIDGEVLNSNIRDIINELYDKERRVCKPASKLQIAKLRLIEFFVLCCRRSLTMKKSDYSLTKSDNWRQHLDQSYIIPLGATKNIIFEITAPFFNIVYPELAYQRFHPDLYELAWACEESLLHSLLDNWIREDDRNKFADLMSRICIRNMEILVDLNKWLTAKKDKLRAENEDARNVLIQFFRLFSPDKPQPYAVKSYDLREDERSYHQIDFNPLANLADAIDFDKLTTDEENSHNPNPDILILTSLFKKIYNPVEEIQDKITYSFEEYSQRILEIGASDSLIVNTEVKEIFNNSGAEMMTARNLISGLLDFPLVSQSLLRSLFISDLQKVYKVSYLEKRKDSITDLENEIKFINNELRSLKKNHTELDKSLAEVTASLESDKDTYQKLSEQRLKKSGEATDIESSMNNIMNEISGLSKQQDQISDKISKADHKVSDSKTNLVYEEKESGLDLIAAFNEVDSRIKNLKIRHSQLDSRLNKINNDITILDNELSVQQSKMDKARNEHDYILGQLNSCNNHINDLELRKDNLSIMKKKLDSDYKDLERRLRILFR